MQGAVIRAQGYYLVFFHHEFGEVLMNINGNFHLYKLIIFQVLHIFRCIVGCNLKQPWANFIIHYVL